MVETIPLAAYTASLPSHGLLVKLSQAWLAETAASTRNRAVEVRTRRRDRIVLVLMG
jgi:hypothetical protein